MNLLHLSFLLLAISGSYATESTSQCPEKQDGDSGCEERVQVNASTAIAGLIDDVPKEVYEAFVVASTECLQCVDESSVKVLSNGGTGDSGSSYCECKGCGESYEMWLNCWSCCDFCRCEGCDWNQGLGDWHLRVCDDCCVNPGVASLMTTDEGSVKAVDFNINVCMDTVKPLDSSATSYVDHTQMLADFETELEQCYRNKDSFLDTWSSLCADSGIDLSLMVRTEGQLNAIMFGSNGLDSENVVVTTYSSDESHRSTSHMIFYSALGFVTVSAFAVFGTAVVVRVLNKRKEAEEEQAAKWVSELTSVDTENPLSSPT